jgi:uncharacterized repeat protein (TIGR04042 family)
MPEMHFQIRWPDGEEERCYSPSLVITELISAEKTYPVYEFMERVGAGLRIAAERVRAKYGFYCTAAQEQLATLERRAKSFEPLAPVLVLELELPAGAAAPATRVVPAAAAPAEPHTETGAGT